MNEINKFPEQEQIIQMLNKFSVSTKTFMIARLFLFVSFRKLINLPRVIITPLGVMIDRRRLPSDYHYIGERRFSEIVRHSLKVYLYREDDSNPSRS